MLWVTLLLISLTIVFIKLWVARNYWKNRKVPVKEPVLFFGNMLDNVLRKKSLLEVIDDLYKFLPNARYLGFHELLTPILVVKDPALIKQICIKDFDVFPEHRSLSGNESIEPLWDRNLLAANGAKWKELRPILSPTFTSSKMKMMFHLMDDCAQRFVQYFMKQSDQSSHVEMKDIISRFTNDVIATTAFGIECNSLENRNNEFYLMGKDITNFTGLRTLKFFALTLCPRLMKIFGITLFVRKTSQFFIDVIRTTIQERETRKILRPDLINLLLQAKRNNGLKYEDDKNILNAGFASVEESGLGKHSRTSKEELSDEDLYAQCLVFFFAGFDTVSNALSLALYELALNPDIQEKLRMEVEEVWQECDGKLNYEALVKMRYMDMVVSESLRKWPPAALTDRKCVKSYTIQPVSPSENPLTLNPGELITIPIRSIHHDDKYFSDPDTFDPERFNDENKTKIKEGVYIPFGIGPRHCIGSRFALLEMKTLLFHVLLNFEIVRSEKTEVPLVFSKTNFDVTTENGIWLTFNKRDK